MKKESTNILKSICGKTQSDTGYILQIKNKTGIITQFYGKDNSPEDYSNLNKLFAGKKKPTLTELRNHKYFLALTKEKKYKSVFSELIFEYENVSYYLMLFTKNKFPGAKTLIDAIKPSLEKIKKKIINADKTDKLSVELTSQEIEFKESIKEALDSIHTVIFSTNADGSEYFFITEAVRNLFGYTPDEIYRNKFLILRSIAKEHFLKFRQFADTLKSGEPSIVEYKMKDRFGKEHWVRHTGIPILRNGKVQRVVGTINDMTDEKTVQLKLESSEEKFRMLIDTAEDLIFILNGFGYLSMVNKNGANELGFSPEEMIGKHFMEFIDKDDEFKVIDAFSNILKSAKVVNFEVSFVDRFEKRIAFEVSAKPFIRDGEISGMISIARNIKNRKLDEHKILDLNAKLIEANRIISIERERARQKINVLEELHKLKSEFISNISHELRTPLASIVGFAETISSDSDLPHETVKEFSEIILSEGRRLAKLINDVLDFSKLESGEEEIKLEDIDIIKLLNQTALEFEEQLEQKQLHLSKEYPADEIIIKADEKRIEQVFYNLISNAVKFTPNGGRISLLVNDYDNEVEIAVSDTGVGIPEKDIPKLFQRFSKIYRPGAPVTGAGFGLATVKQIVNLHKGYIKVKSEENRGSTFIIRLSKKQFK